MTNFMIGDDLTLLIGHYAVLLLLTADSDKFEGLEEVFLIYVLSALLNCIDGSFVYDIRKVGTNQTCRSKSKCVEINGIIHRNILGMNLEGLLTSLYIRTIYNDTTIETTRTKKCLIEDFRTVGCSQDQKTLRRIETIHLSKELI